MYKRRIKVFFALVFFVMLILTGRLGYLQIVKGPEHLDEAILRVRNIQTLPPTRGRILDRQGRILAMDDPCFDLSLHYQFMTNDPNWSAAQRRRIEKQTGVSPSDAQKILQQRVEESWRIARAVAGRYGEDLPLRVGKVVRRIRRMSRNGTRDIAELYQYHAVVKGLDGQTALEIKSKLPGTVGLKVGSAHRRLYPRGRTASHVIGLMGRFDGLDPNAADKYNHPGDLPDWVYWRDRYRGGDLIGISGIEKMCEPDLRGRRGYRVYHAGKLHKERSATVGRDVQLTLDADFQDAIADAFVRMLPPGSTGSVVVLSVPRGEVLALVSIPTYDLNHYRRDFSYLVGEKVTLPLRNRAISQCYAPGSTLKPITALAALGAAKITPHSEFHCNGGLFTPNPQWAPKCWIAPLGGEHGMIDLKKALRYSCNVYFDHLGQLLGPELLCEWLRKFGFGALPGTHLPEERSGTVPVSKSGGDNPHKSHPLSIGDAWQMAIGQGRISASPLHVANAMATVARGGRFLSPLLVTHLRTERIERDLRLPPDSIVAVQEGMHEVVHHRTGTANKYIRAELASLDCEFYGKTGTAQVPPQRIDSNADRRITAEDMVVRTGNVAWFSGFAPYGRGIPEVAFAVMVEYVSGGAAQHAAPIAAEVVRLGREFGYIQ